MGLIRKDKNIKGMVLDRVDTALWHWVTAFNMRTPYMERKNIHCFANPHGNRTIEVIRSLVYRCTPLRMAMWDERLFVAPPEWPAGFSSINSFGLKEAPSPYEVACAILVAPEVGSRFWGFKQYEGEGKAIAHWWLAGMPVEAIQELLGQKKGRWVSEMEKYFSALVKSRKFKLWALGTNPVPACPNRITAQILKRVLKGEARRGNVSRGERNAWERFWAHPYISTQIKTGARRCPIERTLYRPGVVWPSVEDKLEWVYKEGGNQDEVRKTVAWLESRVYKKPKWLEPLKFPKQDILAL